MCVTYLFHQTEMNTESREQAFDFFFFFLGGGGGEEFVHCDYNKSLTL